MVAGESFEGNWSRDNMIPLPQREGESPPVFWNHLHDGKAIFSKDTKNPFHGLASQRVELVSGTFALVSNRGIGNEGLVLQGGKEYTGYVFAKAIDNVKLTVAMHDVASGGAGIPKVIASTVIRVSGGSKWAKYNFSLTPNASTTCTTIPFGSDPQINCSNAAKGSYRPEPGDVCQRCGGELALGVTVPGQVVDLDFVALHPGEWGLYKGLEVRRDGVELLEAMGVTAIRQGGSFADAAYYSWKNWRGRKWDRPSFGAVWGYSYESSWGPFEFIDMANAMGIEPIMDTAADATISGGEIVPDGHQPTPKLPTICCSPADMGDLVEYCWGNATTKWGRQRIDDGHPSVYNVTWFELGNEQRNRRFVDEVQAMEARAISLGLEQKLHYLWPDTHYIGEDLNSSELARAKALGLKDRLVMDLHTGATGGVPLSQAFFENATQSAGEPGTMNCEVNAATHGMDRALTEALDLNSFFNYNPKSTSGEQAPRLKGRTSSFCMERSGEADSHFAQGLSFFAADKMWLQPGGWVHKMFHDSWQPWTAEVALGGQQLPRNECGLQGAACQPRWMDGTAASRPDFCCVASASAAFSEDRRQLTLRFVNPSNTSRVKLSVQLPGWRLLNVSQLASNNLTDGNSYQDPMHISPTLAPRSQDGGTTFLAPPQSISVALFVN